FDANGDGEITLAELQQAMQRLLGEKLTPREISEVVQEADINGDGTVDFEGNTLGRNPGNLHLFLLHVVFQATHSLHFSKFALEWYAPVPFLLLR
ncbi:calcium-binding protein 5, partial [Cricetulus griseus]